MSNSINLGSLVQVAVLKWRKLISLKNYVLSIVWFHCFTEIITKTVWNVSCSIGALALSLSCFLRQFFELLVVYTHVSNVQSKYMIFLFFIFPKTKESKHMYLLFYHKRILIFQYKGTSDQFQKESGRVNIQVNLCTEKLVQLIFIYLIF